MKNLLHLSINRGDVNEIKKRYDTYTRSWWKCTYIIFNIHSYIKNKKKWKIYSKAAI